MKQIAVLFGCMTLALLAARIVLVPCAPDGLESVAGALGFADLAVEGEAWSPFADYETRFFESVWFARLSAGLLGVVLLCGLGVFWGRSLPRRKGDG
jgi:hypothetical protein